MHYFKKFIVFLLLNFTTAQAIGLSLFPDNPSQKHTSSPKKQIKIFVSDVDAGRINTVKANSNPDFVDKLDEIHKNGAENTHNGSKSILPWCSQFQATIEKDAREYVCSKNFQKSHASIYPTRQTRDHFIDSAVNLHKWINDLLSIHFSPVHKRCFTIIDNILEVNYNVFEWYQANYSVLSSTDCRHLKALIKTHFDKNPIHETYLESRSWTPYLPKVRFDIQK